MRILPSQTILPAFVIRKLSVHTRTSHSVWCLAKYQVFIQLRHIFYPATCNSLLFPAFPSTFCIFPDSLNNVIIFPYLSRFHWPAGTLLSKFIMAVAITRSFNDDDTRPMTVRPRMSMTGCPMIRMGVSGWIFLLVLAYPGSPGQKAVKRLCVCVWNKITNA